MEEISTCNLNVSGKVFSWRINTSAPIKVFSSINLPSIPVMPRSVSLYDSSSDVMQYEAV